MQNAKDSFAHPWPLELPSASFAPVVVDFTLGFTANVSVSASHDFDVLKRNREARIVRNIKFGPGFPMKKHDAIVSNALKNITQE